MHSSLVLASLQENLRTEVASMVTTHENNEERRRSILGSIDLLTTGLPLSSLD